MVESALLSLRILDDFFSSGAKNRDDDVLSLDFDFESSGFLTKAEGESINKILEILLFRNGLNNLHASSGELKSPLHTCWWLELTHFIMRLIGTLHNKNSAKPRKGRRVRQRFLFLPITRGSVAPPAEECLDKMDSVT